MNCPICKTELNKDNSLSFYNYKEEWVVTCQSCQERIHGIAKQSENDTKEILKIVKNISSDLAKMWKKQDEYKKKLLEDLRELGDGKITYKRRNEEMVVTLEKDSGISERESMREGRKLAEIIEKSESMDVTTDDKSIIVVLRNDIPVVELEGFQC